MFYTSLEVTIILSTLAVYTYYMSLDLYETQNEARWRVQSCGNPAEDESTLARVLLLQNLLTNRQYHSPYQSWI